MREITPAEYDAALRRAPGDCPLLCVGGAARARAELLAGLAADLRHAARVRAAGAARWSAQLNRIAADLAPRLARILPPAAIPASDGGGDARGDGQRGRRRSGGC